MRQLRFFRWIRYKYLTFIRIKDKPHNIAVGAALGISLDVVPTFGLGVVVAFFIARLIRVNSLAAVISAVVFKLAIPFFVFINIKTGGVFIEDPDVLNTERYARAELLPNPWLGFDWSHLGQSYLLGSVVNAAVIFVVTYLVVLQFVRWRRSKS